jgi:Domain of unknown function (DUF4333)
VVARARTLLPLFAALTVVFAGCGTTKIDSKKAEKLIRSSIAQAGNTVSSVHCPGGVEAKKGKTFDCTFALTDGRHGTVTVHMTNDKGHVLVHPGDYHVQR